MTRFHYIWLSFISVLQCELKPTSVFVVIIVAVTAAGEPVPALSGLMISMSMLILTLKYQKYEYIDNIYIAQRFEVALARPNGTRAPPTRFA